jgi:hypothetical protein
MDAYLSKEALNYLEAERLGSPRNIGRGLLLGHRRGPRFFVEKVYPLGGRGFPSEIQFWEFDRVFGGRIIGFYASGSRRRSVPQVLRPFAYGKLFLEIADSSNRQRRLALKPHVIEYDDHFFLSPIALAKRPR